MPPGRRGCSPCTSPADRVGDLEPVADAAELLAPRTRSRACGPPRPLRRYIVALLGHTRVDPRVELGASPRAGLLLLRAAKACSAAAGSRPTRCQTTSSAWSRRCSRTASCSPPDAFDATGEEVVAAAVAATPAL